MGRNLLLLVLAVASTASCDRPTKPEELAVEKDEPAAPAPAPEPIAKKEAEPAKSEPVLAPPPAALAMPSDEDLTFAEESSSTVLLPTKPVFSAARVPAQFDDKSLSVHGLRQDLDARFKEGNAGTEVRVRATVREIFIPPPCPAEQLCAQTVGPHVWISDRADEGHKRSLQVVGFSFAIPEFEAERWKGVPKVELVVGREYTISGIFTDKSDLGFAEPRGLLEFRTLVVKDASGAETLIAPPGAPWHPLAGK
jgi:hypothetical protein